MKNYEDILKHIYEKYAPEKISNLSQLIGKYEGREDELLESIMHKYNIPVQEVFIILKYGKKKPLYDAIIKVYNEQIQPTVKYNYKEVLNNIYINYSPEKLPSVNALLDKYQGHENELIESVFKKYNVPDEKRKLFISKASPPQKETPAQDTSNNAEDLSVNVAPKESELISEEVSIATKQKTIPQELEAISHDETAQHQEVVSETVAPTEEGHTQHTNATEEISLNKETGNTDSIATEEIAIPDEKLIKERQTVDTFKIGLDDEEQNPKKKINIGVLMAILIPSLIVVGLVVTLLLHFNGKINIAMLNDIIPPKNKTLAEAPISSTQKTEIQVIDKKPEQIEVQENKEASEATEEHTTTNEHVTEVPVVSKPTMPTVTPTTTDSKFFIIAGSYATVELANEAMQVLKSKGFANPKLVDQNQFGHWRIAFKGYPSRQEAQNDLEHIKQTQIPTAWIYQKK